jgi:hypothetical protein
VPEGVAGKVTIVPVLNVAPFKTSLEPMEMEIK